jgi:hypothetical protein
VSHPSGEGHYGGARVSYSYNYAYSNGFGKIYSYTNDNTNSYDYDNSNNTRSDNGLPNIKVLIVSDRASYVKLISQKYRKNTLREQEEIIIVIIMVMDYLIVKRGENPPLWGM